MVNLSANIADNYRIIDNSANDKEMPDAILYGTSIRDWWVRYFFILAFGPKSIRQITKSARVTRGVLGGGFEEITYRCRTHTKVGKCKL